MTTSPLSPADWSEARSWGVAPAAHLLRRLQTGYRPENLRRVMDEGPEQTVDRLLTEQPEDPSIGPAIASLEQTALATGQIDSLRAAWLLGMTTPINPLREKLTLMWHNHFATSYAKVQSVGMPGGTSERCCTKSPVTRPCLSGWMEIPTASAIPTRTMPAS
jgi:hypothetical protein